MEGRDLKTLEHVKFLFELHSDNSCDTNGYRSLLEEIENVKNNVVLDAVIKCENFKCDNKADYFYCNDCENERNDI